MIKFPKYVSLTTILCKNCVFAEIEIGSNRLTCENPENLNVSDVVTLKYCKKCRKWGDTDE